MTSLFLRLSFCFFGLPRIPPTVLTSPSLQPRAGCIFEIVFIVPGFRFKPSPRSGFAASRLQHSVMPKVFTRILSSELETVHSDRVKTKNLSGKAEKLNCDN